MKFYIDCVSGYSILTNELNLSTKYFLVKRSEYINLFRQCFTNGCVRSQCGRNIIEIQVLLKNISGVIKTIPDSDYYVQFRKALGYALSGITTTSNCSDESDNYKPEKSKRTSKKKEANFEWNEAIVKLRKS